MVFLERRKLVIKSSSFRKGKMKSKLDKVLGRMKMVKTDGIFKNGKE